MQDQMAGQLGWRRHWTWAKWVVAFTLLAVVIVRHREGVARIAREPLDWPSLLTALVLCGSACLLTFVRWFLLVKAQGFAFTIRDALRLSFIGYLLNFVAPGAVGGDIVKASLLAKEHPSRRAVAVATVLLDRILGLLALFIIGACAAWPLWPQIREQPELQAAVGLLAGGSAAGLVGLCLMLLPIVTHMRWWQPLARLPVVGHMIHELVEGVQLYQARRSAVFAALGLSLIGHFGTISSFYFSARAVGGETTVPNYLAHLFFVPAAEFIGVILPVPGGVGALEYAVERFYHLAGAADGIGVLTCLAYRAVTLTVALVGVGYYMTARREIDQALHVGDEPANP